MIQPQKSWGKRGILYQLGGIDLVVGTVGVGCKRLGLCCQSLCFPMDLLPNHRIGDDVLQRNYLGCLERLYLSLGKLAQYLFAGLRVEFQRLEDETETK